MKITETKVSLTDKGKTLVEIELADSPDYEKNEQSVFIRLLIDCKDTERLAAIQKAALRAVQNELRDQIQALTRTLDRVD